MTRQIIARAVKTLAPTTPDPPITESGGGGMISISTVDADGAELEELFSVEVGLEEMGLELGRGVMRVDEIGLKAIKLEEMVSDETVLEVMDLENLDVEDLAIFELEPGVIRVDRVGLLTVYDKSDVLCEFGTSEKREERDGIKEETDGRRADVDKVDWGSGTVGGKGGT